MAHDLAYTARKLDAQKAREALRAGVLEIASTISVRTPLSIRGTKWMITFARHHSMANRGKRAAEFKS